MLKTVTFSRHAMGFVFGVSLMAFGCAGILQKADTAGQAYIQKVSPPTTQAATAVAQTAGAVVAVTPPGSPINSLALIVTAIAGAILAADKGVITIANLIHGMNTIPPPASTPAVRLNADHISQIAEQVATLVSVPVPVPAVGPIVPGPNAIPFPNVGKGGNS